MAALVHARSLRQVGGNQCSVFEGEAEVLVPPPLLPNSIVHHAHSLDETLHLFVVPEWVPAYVYNMHEFACVQS